jgi:hypothetical protein
MGEGVGLLDAAGQIAGILTAVFTGIFAYLEIRRQRGEVTAHWSVEFTVSRPISAICTLRNTTGRPVKIDRVQVSGPVRNVEAYHAIHKREAKHPSWAANVAPLQLSVEPDKPLSFVVSIEIDPVAASKELRSLSAKVRLWCAKKLWSWLGWKLQSGVKISISATMFRSLRSIRPSRITETIRISEQTIKQIEEKASQPGP